MSIARHARTTSLLTLLSKMLGLLRDTLFAGAFGVGSVADAFHLAFMVPNLFRRFLGEGALTSAFIPMLAEAGERGGDEARRLLVDRVLSALLALLGGLTALLVLLAFLLPTGGWGSEFPPEKARLTFRLTAFLLPFLPLISVTAFLSAVLQVSGRFAPPAAASVMLNLAALGGIFVLCPLFGSRPEARVYGFAAAMLLGGLLGLLIQIGPLRRAGYRPRPARDLGDPALRRLGRTMVPLVLGLLPAQVNVLLDRAIAESLIPGHGAVTLLSLASHFAFVPVGLIGFALGTAVFPALSRHHVRGERDALRALLEKALRVSLFISLPAAAAFIALGEPIIRLLCEEMPRLLLSGRFGSEDTRAAARVLLFYALGIPALSALQVAIRASYAIGAQTVAVRIGLVAVLSNLALNLLLVRPLGAAGLALATSLSAVLQLGLLNLLLRRRLAGVEGRAVGAFLLRAAPTAGAVGALSYGLWRLLQAPAGAGFPAALLETAAPLLLLAGLFLAASAVTSPREARLIWGALRGERAS